MKLRSFVSLAAVLLLTGVCGVFAQITTRSLHPSVAIAPAGREIGTNDSIRIVYTPARDTGNTMPNAMTLVPQVFAYTTARSVGANNWESAYQVSEWPMVGGNPRLQMTRQGAGWVLSIPSIRSFYNVAAGTNLDQLLFVFRNAEGTVQGRDVAIQLSRTATSVRNNDIFSSASVYPNPTAEYANISFGLKAASTVNVRIFDARGNEVKTLVNNQSFPANAIHLVEWDATNNNGLKVANGAYFYRVEVGASIETGSIVINR
ncbi:MAG: T9SS type A sorting domain-containing protein [Candidatus Kapabacteria bacterium]|nr:T9SS type A sorting domain-containing protein [Candidatus Kapabacteria bacterium]